MSALGRWFPFQMAWFLLLLSLVLGTSFEVHPSEAAGSPRPLRSVCRVLLIPGAITGEEGGGSGFFIRAGAVFAELQAQIKSDGHEVILLSLPSDLGVAARGLALRDRVQQLRRQHLTKDGKGGREVWIAHSQAGVDARYALKQDPSLHEGVEAVLTLATPHLGTELGAWAAQEGGRGGWLGWSLRLLARYDLSALSFLSDLSPEGIQKGEAKLLGTSDEFARRFFSARFRCREAGCSWPFRLLEWVSGVPGHGGQDGDGLVSLKSQAFGAPFGAFELDHLEQVGGGTDRPGEIERGRFHQAVRSWLKEKCT